MDNGTAMILAEGFKVLFSAWATWMKTKGATDEEIAIMWKSVGDEFLKNGPETFPSN